MKTIKTCIGIATLCIALLTGLAGYLLISNFDTIDSKVSINSEQCDCSNSNTNKTIVNNNQPKSSTDKSSTIVEGSSNADNYNGLLDSIVYNVTLAVNSVSNVITSGSIFIGIITLFIGIVGLFGYHHLKEDINRYSSIFKKTEKLVNSAEEVKKSLSIQQSYIDKSNDSLFNTLYSIANQLQDKDRARMIIQKQLHAIQIINLYRPCVNPEDYAEVNKKKNAALLFLWANGDIKDLKHLEFVIDKDNNDDIRKQAQELSVFISLKNCPDSFPSKYKSSLGK